MNDKFQWNEFGKVSSAMDLELYLANREYNHGDYCHYTSLEIIDKILKNNEFWLSCVDNFNDVRDSEQFAKDELKNYYALCFATGITENLSLWYLYSGIDGKGGRIKLTKSGIAKLLKSPTFELWSENDKIKELTDDDFTIKFKDIIYYKSNKLNVDLKYNTMTNHCLSVNEFDEYKNNNIGFCKGTIWYYEKETRLLIKVNDKLIKKDKKYVVKLKFEDSLKKYFKIHLAPEIDSYEILDMHSNIKKFMESTSCVQHSVHKGEVKMNLLDKYTKGKKDK